MVSISISYCVSVMDSFVDNQGRFRDPHSGLVADVRFVQPYQARKIYTCPSCNYEVLPKVGHYVIVPIEAPDMRRHWHRRCWEKRKP